MHSDLYPVGRASAGRALVEEQFACEDCGFRERSTQGTTAHARMRAAWDMEADPADESASEATDASFAAEADVD